MECQTCDDMGYVIEIVLDEEGQEQERELLCLDCDALDDLPPDDGVFAQSLFW